MGTDSINSKATSPVSSIFTPASGFAIVSDGLTQYKLGNMVSLGFSIKKTDGTEFSLNRSVLGTLAAGWRPQNQRIMVMSGSKVITNILNTVSGNIMILPNGQVSVDIINVETKEVHINCTYIAGQ